MYSSEPPESRDSSHAGSRAGSRAGSLAGASDDTHDTVVFQSPTSVWGLSAGQAGVWFVEAVGDEERPRSRLWCLHRKRPPEILFEHAGVVNSPVGYGGHVYLACDRALVRLPLVAGGQPEVLCSANELPTVVLADALGMAWCAPGGGATGRPSMARASGTWQMPGFLVLATREGDGLVEQQLDSAPHALCADQQSIYVATERALVSVARPAGPAVALGEHSGGIESLCRAGRWLYFTRPGGVSRIPVSGGPFEHILDVEYASCAVAGGGERVFIGATDSAMTCRVMAVTPGDGMEVVWTGSGHLIDAAYYDGQLLIITDDRRVGRTAVHRVPEAALLAGAPSRPSARTTRAPSRASSRAPSRASSRAPVRAATGHGASPASGRPPEQPSLPTLLPVEPRVIAQLASTLSDTDWLEIWRDDAGAVRMLRVEDREAMAAYEADGSLLARFPKSLAEDWRVEAESVLTRECRRSRLAGRDARDNPVLGALDELIVSDLNQLARLAGDFDDRRRHGGANVHPGPVSQNDSQNDSQNGSQNDSQNDNQGGPGDYTIELSLVQAAPAGVSGYLEKPLGLAYRISPAPMQIVERPSLTDLRRATGWAADGQEPAKVDGAQEGDELATSVFVRTLPESDSASDNGAGQTSGPFGGDGMNTDIQRALAPLPDDSSRDDDPDDELATSILVAKPEGDELATSVYPSLNASAEPAQLPSRLILHLRAPATHERPHAVDRAIEVTRLPFAIGRSSKRVDLPIRCGDVSRTHCRIAADADGLYVEQIGERSSTIVDGIPVHYNRRSSTLYHGSRILVGDAEIVCELS